MQIKENLLELKKSSSQKNQRQTNKAFSSKWKSVSKTKREPAIHFQRKWFLQLYGFRSESNFKRFLSTKKFIFDAGCGLGEKSAWVASLAPHATVIGMDFSESIYIASRNFKKIPNLYFIRGDIANTPFKKGIFDFVLCDQVIMHTEFPEKTFSHLTKLLRQSSFFACYVYAKKALPRELVDDYFRIHTHKISEKDLWEMSRQLADLGKRLSSLNVKFKSPEIPLLGIKKGEYDIQRFIYWNFLKCFWNDDLGTKTSIATNFDWYSPSNAKRYSEQEFRNLIEANLLKIVHFHKEEACYSGLFKSN